MRRFAPLACASSLVLLAVACSSANVATAQAAPSDAGPPPPADAGADASPPVDAGSPPAPAPLPRIPDQGGATLPGVKVVTITFPNDPHESAVSSFGDWVVGSDWLAQVGAEYGVGGAGTHAHVVLADPAPASVSTEDTEARIASLLGAGTIPGGLSATPTSYLYMIVYPPTTTMSDLAPGEDCAALGDVASAAWHESVSDPARAFAYAVIPTCSAEPSSTLELAMSHELIEAMTDAYPLTTPAYQMPMSTSWYFAGAGEVGDLCEGVDSYEDSGFTLARVWSNAAARAGTWPCVPAPATPYVNVASEKDAPIVAHAGDTVTVALHAWATAPTGAWSVMAYANDARVTASLDRASVVAGDTVTLTANVAKTATEGTMPIAVSIYSKGPSGYVVWPVRIDVQ